MGQDLWGIDEEDEGEELNFHTLDKRKKLDKLASASRKHTRKAIAYSDKPTHPSIGFYYIYDRKPDSPVNHGAYEVVGILQNTECDVDMVAFRPLYEGKTPITQNAYMAMPLLKFTSLVVGPGNSRMPRYRLIKEPKIIAELWKFRHEMYPTPGHMLELEPGEEMMHQLRLIASTGILGKTPSEVALRLFRENFDLIGIHARLSRLD